MTKTIRLALTATVVAPGPQSPSDTTPGMTDDEVIESIESLRRNGYNGGIAVYSRDPNKYSARMTILTARILGEGEDEPRHELIARLEEAERKADAAARMYESANDRAKDLKERLDIAGHVQFRMEQAAILQRQVFDKLNERYGKLSDPLPMRLTCPTCGELHVDAGVFATKPHHTHACQACGAVWRPAIEPTVGVQFLPGFKDPT